jgi:hypothetical protein
MTWMVHLTAEIYKLGIELMTYLILWQFAPGEKHGNDKRRDSRRPAQAQPPVHPD